LSHTTKGAWEGVLSRTYYGPRDDVGGRKKKGKGRWDRGGGGVVGSGAINRTLGKSEKKRKKTGRGNRLGAQGPGARKKHPISSKNPQRLPANTKWGHSGIVVGGRGGRKSLRSTMIKVARSACGPGWRGKNRWRKQFAPGGGTLAKEGCDGRFGRIVLPEA